MKEVIIRRFVEGEENIISTLIRRTLKEVNTDDPKWENDWLYEHYTPENVLKASKESHTYVILLEGEIVGTGSIRVDKELSEKMENKQAEVFACFIHPEHIKEGLGGKLFKVIENDEIFLNANRVWLTTSVMARGFYEHLGYTYTYGYLGKDEDKLIPMQKLPTND